MTEPQTQNLPYLDGWRGLAIVAVLVAHFTPKEGAPTWLGDLGVALFFVLSGYLMANLLFIKKVRLTDFFARRFSRVFPTFWLFVAAMLVYAAIVQPKQHLVSAVDFFSTIFFVRTYLPSDVSIWAGQWPIGHIWSLNVEEHSYVFLAAAALLIRRAPGRVAAAWFLVASTLAVLAMNKYYYSHPPSGASPWFLRSETASLGLLAAAAIRVLNGILPERWAKPMWLLPVLAFVIGVLCFTDYAHGLLKYTAGPLLLAYSINHLQQAPVAIRKLFSMSILRKFGLASFSIYLWQQPFYYLVRDSGYSSWLMFFAAIAVGFASFYAFEDPIRQLLNRKWAERKEAKAFAATQNRPAKVGS